MALVAVVMGGLRVSNAVGPDWEVREMKRVGGAVQRTQSTVAAAEAAAVADTGRAVGAGRSVVYSSVDLAGEMGTWTVRLLVAEAGMPEAHMEHSHLLAVAVRPVRYSDCRNRMADMAEALAYTGAGGTAVVAVLASDVRRKPAGHRESVRTNRPPATACSASLPTSAAWCAFPRRCDAACHPPHTPARIARERAGTGADPARHMPPSGRACWRRSRLFPFRGA